MKKSIAPAFIILSILLFPGILRGQTEPYSQYLHHPWVDSVLTTLSTEERIAQSVWLVTGSDWELPQYVEADRLIRQHGIGGLIFTQGNTLEQAGIIKYYQSVSKVSLTIAMEGGLDMDKLFIDPIILPVNVSPKNPGNCMQVINQIRMFADPPPHLILGLSNVSQRCNNRELINRTYLAMAMAQGLDAAIMDPLDTELMDTAITADLLNEEIIYCDSFLQAARSR